MTDNSEPIFKSVFGDQWDELPLVMKKHYANHPYSNDRVIVEGTLNVKTKGILKLFKPFYRWIGSIPLIDENAVPVIVTFESSMDSNVFHFNRVFHFSSQNPYEFRSQMMHQHGNNVVEKMRFGFCWRTSFHYQNNKVIMRHKGYALYFFGRLLPLPVTLLFGRGDAQEVVVDDNHFDMKVEITHFIFGVIYSYAGRFKVTKVR